MARQRSPESEKAETLYRKGMKLTDIADRLGVPAVTVRRWKSTQKWDEQTSKRGKDNRKRTSSKANAKSERKANVESERKPNVRKSGGQPGNVNSVGNPGGGAPLGNKNSLVHGGYSKVYWDSLSDEEQEMISEMYDDPEIQLIDQIKLYAVSERRIMQAIKKLTSVDENAPGHLGVYITEVVRGEKKRSFKNKEEEIQYREAIEKKVASGDRLPGESYDLTTVTRSTLDQVTRLQQQLTTTQSKKTEAIKALYQLRMDKKKLDAEANGNSLVHAWIEGLMDVEGGNADG